MYRELLTKKKRKWNVFLVVHRIGALIFQADFFTYCLGHLYKEVQLFLCSGLGVYLQEQLLNSFVSGLSVKIIVVVITIAYIEKYCKGGSSCILYCVVTGSEYTQVYVFEQSTHLLRFTALLAGLYLLYFKGAFGQKIMAISYYHTLKYLMCYLSAYSYSEKQLTHLDYSLISCTRNVHTSVCFPSSQKLNFILAVGHHRVVFYF